MRAKSRKEKSEILDEYCHNMGQCRKYAIRKIQPRVNLGSRQRKKRKERYDGEVLLLGMQALRLTGT